mmetsp:Transcript_6836/g.12436  ORF Transcript_6836/g.12436 Transcript_6836/m.12436 type:complete len:238 (-) Transcript_6836:187-900(-)
MATVAQQVCYHRLKFHQRQLPTLVRVHLLKRLGKRAISFAQELPKVLDFLFHVHGDLLRVCSGRNCAAGVQHLRCEERVPVHPANTQALALQLAALCFLPTLEEEHVLKHQVLATALQKKQAEELFDLRLIFITQRPATLHEQLQAHSVGPLNVHQVLPHVLDGMMVLQAHNSELLKRSSSRRVQLFQGDATCIPGVQQMPQRPNVAHVAQPVQCLAELTHVHLSTTIYVQHSPGSG